jgi:oligopeptide transport system ATP-binding protein
VPLLDVKELKTYFHTRYGVIRAVNGVSFSVEHGETLGIVGESGSGKTVANLTMLGLIPMPPGRIEGGSAMFEGADLLKMPEDALRGIRGRRISMIFQDPMTALNPYLTIGEQIVETLEIRARQLGLTRADIRKSALEMVHAVGIPNPELQMRAYPHEFSGGMRQRVMIAMALIAKPALLIADEPTTALDVTVQAQILLLIKDMQRRLGMATILITHNLAVVASTCDRVIVMYAGQILETADVTSLFRKPKHPYTQALMDSLPSAGKAKSSLYAIPGMPPDLSRPITGCPFAPRCAHATQVCNQPVALKPIGPGRETACARVQGGEL